MKKTLVALAALAATSAFAQSSVSITGNADVAYATKSVTGGDGKTFLKSTGIGDGAMVPNRIILTVTEDLGGGLKATFKNEHGISPANGTDWGARANNAAPIVIGSRAASTTDAQIPADAAVTTSTNRGTFVGLSGNFGAVNAGYLVSSSYNLSSQSGYLLGMEQYGALLHTFGLTEVGGSRANGIEYVSPVFKGFKATVQKQYGAERTWEADGTNQPYTVNKAERGALRIDYSAGPLNVGYATTQYNARKIGPNGNNAANVFGVAGSAASYSGASAKLDQLNASYVYGALKGTFSMNKATVDNTTDTSDRTLKAQTFGLEYTTGAVTAYVITGTGTADSPTARVNDIKQQQIGVKYALSKRTTAYFVTGESKDSVPTAADKMSKGTISGVGLAHAF